MNDARKTALILVDVINSFFEPGHPNYYDGVQDVLPALRTLRDAACALLGAAPPPPLVPPPVWVTSGSLPSPSASLLPPPQPAPKSADNTTTRSPVTRCFICLVAPVSAMILGHALSALAAMTTRMISLVPS